MSTNLDNIRFYDEQLKSEINADREAHGKKPLKDKEDDNSDDDPGNLSGQNGDLKERRKAPQILKADGSIRENTKKSLHMPLKLHATDMDGSLVIQYTLAMNMIP